MAMGTIRNAFVPTPAQWLALAVAMVCLMLQAGGESAQELFQFQRQGLAQGQLWRLFSGHFIHLGWSHALMNMAALGLLVGAVAAWWWAGTRFCLPPFSSSTNQARTP